MQSMSFCIDGPDRLGKDTLIEGLQQELGFFNIIHYQKPKLLKRLQLGKIDSRALEIYQRASFSSMFRLLESSERFILNRSHIGESVYAPRYRGYSGNYVFDLEAKAIDRHAWNSGMSKIDYPAKLILLTTSNWDFIEDDGLSFDFSAKEAEQEDFKKAFELSKLPKLMIDIANSDGTRKTKEEILAEVLKG